MRELTVSARGVGALMTFAASRGSSREALAERSRIDVSVLADDARRVPYSRFVALMRASQELCSDPALALHFGEAVDVSEVSLACTVGDVRTIDEAFAQINRYARLAVEVEGAGDRFELVRHAGQLWIVDTRRNPNDFPELTESTFARMVCSTRRVLGDTPIFKAVHVTHDAPAYRAEYERIFRVPVVFRSDWNGLRLDETLLSHQRIPATSQYVTGVLRDHAEGLLQRLERSQSTRGKVENVLVPLLHTGDTGVAAVAEALGLSRQTLFRRLKAEGVTYEQVLNELRHRTALHYLSAVKVSVKRTARLVGFADATAFSRAFKRWTGTSPRTFLTQSAAPRAP